MDSNLSIQVCAPTDVTDADAGPLSAKPGGLCPTHLASASPRPPPPCTTLSASRVEDAQYRPDSAISFTSSTTAINNLVKAASDSPDGRFCDSPILDGEITEEPDVLLGAAPESDDGTCKDVEVLLAPAPVDCCVQARYERETL